MPLYDYSCPACGTEKEVEHSMSEVGKVEILCDACGQTMKKKLSMPSLIGFDDVGRSGRSKENGKEDTPKKETSIKETKTDSTSKKDSKSVSSTKKEKST